MYGTFTFSYEPATNSTPEDSSIQMSFSSEADLHGILKHFENFLRANGYPLDFGDSLKVSYASEAHTPSTQFEFQPSVNYLSNSVAISPNGNTVDFVTMHK